MKKLRVLAIMLLLASGSLMAQDKGSEGSSFMDKVTDLVDDASEVVMRVTVPVYGPLRDVLLDTDVIDESQTSIFEESCVFGFAIVKQDAKALKPAEGPTSNRYEVKKFLNECGRKKIEKLIDEQ